VRRRRWGDGKKRDGSRVGGGGGDRRRKRTKGGKMTRDGGEGREQSRGEKK